jgi:hypothetical protein
VAYERGIAQARMEIALRKCMLDLFVQRKYLFQKKMEACSCGPSRFDYDDDDDVDGSN